MGIGGPFAGTKARPGRDADHSPPSRAEELYLLSTRAPSWRVVVQLWLFIKHNTKLAFGEASSILYSELLNYAICATVVK
jgi:hypothetical protein